MRWLRRWGRPPFTLEPPTTTTTPPVQVSRGKVNLAAVGLFTQWLAEAIQRSFPDETFFEITLQHWSSPARASVKLHVGTKRLQLWPVDLLDGLLRADNGRGEMLRAEIAAAIQRLGG